MTVPVPALEGLTAHAFGHSYVAAPGVACTSGAEWTARLKRRLGFGQLVNNGQGGIRMFEVAVSLGIPSTQRGITAHPWTPGTRGVAVVEAVTNDAALAGGPATQRDLAGFRIGLRTVLTTLSAATRVSAATATKSGTWSQYSDTGIAGVNFQRTVVQGASLIFSVAGVRRVAVSGTISDPGVSTLVGGVATISVDGVTALVVDRTSQDFQMKAYGPQSFFSGVGGVITLPNTGSHTVTVMKTDSGPGAVDVDGLLLQMAEPPRVFVCKDPMILPTSPYYASMAANIGPYNAAVDTVCAEFPNVTVVDLGGPGWDAVPMVGPDGVHPNDRGMAFIADRLEEALSTLTFTAGVNTI